MDHYSFIKFFHLLLIIIILPFLVQTTLSQNPKFKACESKKCGTNLTISYPFWISHEQESYCGHPNFQITCINQEPILHISKEDYLIRNISYIDQSFLVANTNDLKEPCPTPRRNFTLLGSPFSYNFNDLDLYFFYDCELKPTDHFTYSIPCYKNKNRSHYSFAMILHEEGLEYLNSTSEKCESFVSVPIEVGVDSSIQSMTKMEYSKLLRNGFALEWNSSSIGNCSFCEASGGSCGFKKNEFICFCEDKSYPKSCKIVPPPPKRNIERKVKIGIGAGIGGCVLTGLVVLLIVYCRRRRKRYLDKSSGLISSRNVSPDFSMMPDQEKGFLAPIFSYKELEEATNNFDDAKELGDGGFGTVYHGELKDGRVVAVKRLYENNGKRVEQFMNEVQILSRLRHKNLVILYGCTSRHSRELLLVYEFVPNGTVADHLHGERAGSGLVPWPVRMNIAIETADALKYLHVSEIIHRDVKTNNILLDENFHVKVADFGLSRLFPTDVTHVSTAPQGTPGYVDPEYYQCYQLTSKSDVYSFGVVLVELISSKPAVDISRHRHEINLSNLAINKIHNHALHELIDPSLGFETDSSVKKMITLVAELAFRCLQQDSDMRPSMTEVLEVLKEIENEGSKKAKGVEIDIAADDIGLLKNNISPFSPDSVTQRWDSDITPNTSS